MTSGYVEHAFRRGRPLGYLIRQRCCGRSDKRDHGFGEFDPDRMIGSEMGETDRPSVTHEGSRVVEKERGHLLGAKEMDDAPHPPETWWSGMSAWMA